MLPKSIDGMPVDVEQTGLFRRFAKKPKPPIMPNPKTRIRPAIRLFPVTSNPDRRVAEPCRMAAPAGLLTEVIPYESATSIKVSESPA